MNTIVSESNATFCIERMKMSMKMRLTEHITHARDMRNAYFFFWKTQWKKNNAEYPTVDRRIILK
jgi:hypothetical protein